MLFAPMSQLAQRAQRLPAYLLAVLSAVPLLAQSDAQQQQRMSDSVSRRNNLGATLYTITGRRVPGLTPPSALRFMVA